MNFGLRLGEKAVSRENNFDFLRFFAASQVILFHTFALSRQARLIPIVATQSISSELGTIMDSISEGDRRRFVRKIFNQDESLFASAVDSIGMFASWKDASKFIDQILIRNDVDPYSPEAERFVEVISQQFQPKR